MSRQTESEFKLRADRPIELAAIDAALREVGAECRLADSRRHVDTYLDDDRGSLCRAGIALRMRVGDRDARLTCKLPATSDDGLFVRLELEQTWPTATPPRSAAELGVELRNAIQPFVLGRRLAPRQLLEVRREIRLLTQNGQDLCELAIDFVQARANGRSATFQEIELEVIDDVAGNERLANALHERLPLTFCERDKPTYAAALLGIECATDHAAQESAAEPIASVVRRRLRDHLLAVRRAEIGVREDRGTEPVHEMRVAIRRMRSLVRACRDLWPDEVAARLLGHLGETGRQLGAVRDLDVMLAQLPERVTELPQQLHAAGSRTVHWIKQQRDATRQALGLWLNSAARLTDAAVLEDDLLAIDTNSAAGQEPLARVATAGLAKAVRQLRKLAAQIPEELPGDAVHRLRLAAKRVRYLAEEFSDLPDLDYRRSVRAIARVQQTFGVVCDHENAAERLLGWLHQAASASAESALTAATLGALAANHVIAGRAARGDATKALARADRKRVWRRFPKRPST